MSRTIEALMTHLARPTKRQATLAQTRQLIAEWQEGPTTISGYATRKLRLCSRACLWTAGSLPNAL